MVCLPEEMWEEGKKSQHLSQASNVSHNVSHYCIVVAYSEILMIFFLRILILSGVPTK